MPVRRRASPNRADGQLHRTPRRNVGGEFVYVDRDDVGRGTLKRYKKDSFAWYRKVIASNGADLED